MCYLWVIYNYTVYSDINNIIQTIYVTATTKQPFFVTLATIGCCKKINIKVNLIIHLIRLLCYQVYTSRALTISDSSSLISYHRLYHPQCNQQFGPRPPRHHSSGSDFVLDPHWYRCFDTTGTWKDALELNSISAEPESIAELVFQASGDVHHSAPVVL